MCSNSVWEQFWWSVGGSCKKDSRSYVLKGQVLHASALTEKSQLRQIRKQRLEPETPKQYISNVLFVCTVAYKSQK